MNIRRMFESAIHYKAPKYVEVRSLNLGLLSKGPILLIFLYIVCYQMLYQSRHMVKSRPSGIARMQLQRPTTNHCNVNHPDCEADFTPMSDLSYCSAPGDGDSSEDEESVETDAEEKDEEKNSKLPCRYMDEKQMNHVGFQHFTIMIPTRITRTQQEATGNCGPDSTVPCKNVYKFSNNSKEVSEYVADVERFTLLIETAFTLAPEDLAKTPVRRGASNNFPGFWEVCDDPRLHIGCEHKAIPCLFGDCDGIHKDKKRRLRGSKTDDQTEGRRLGGKKEEKFFGLPFGDVVSVGALLEMAGVDLDQDTDTHGESRRSTGIALQVDVDYDNRKPFRWPPWASGGPGDIRYVYRVSKLPFQTYKEVSEEISASGDRTLVDKHGIFVNVNIEGAVRFFDVTQTLLILTTGLSLLAGVDAAVNFFASNVWHYKDEYKMEKFDRSRNYDRDEAFCFCCSCGQQGNGKGDADKGWEYWADHPEDFTRDLRALDGDTLRCAGDLLMALHRMKVKETQDQSFVDKEKEKWEDAAKRGGSSPQLAGTETKPLMQE